MSSPAKICPTCHTLVDDDKARFCPSCGSPLSTPVEFYDAFISYRRYSGSHLAQLIRTSLQYSRGMNVFVDVNELRSGEFDKKLLTIIGNSPNFVVILTRGSLDRCRNEGDWLRQEIAHAIKTGRNVIPVMCDGFMMPAASSLPRDVSRLTSFNAVYYDDRSPDSSLTKIANWCRNGGGSDTKTVVPTANPVVPPKPKEPEPKTGDVKTIMLPGDVPLELVYIAPGTFLMGSPENEPGRFYNETQHRVTLTKGYWMGKYQVTQEQWQALMGNNPSCFKNAGANAPVDSVSWTETQEFFRKLTERERAAGRLPAGYEYTLPTEAQWEYACRAGTDGPYGGNGVLASMGWYDENSGSKTHPVGQKQPNAWGLYDMHGNVWEWCYDGYGSYPCGSVSDPAGASSDTVRVTRGGGWLNGAQGCRSAYRYGIDYGFRIPGLGFRLALSSDQKRV